MSQYTVITEGFGGFGTAALVIIEGYSQTGAEFVAPPSAAGGGAEGTPARRRRYPRRVVYRGLVRNIRSAEEERAFLEMLADEARTLAAITDDPEERAQARRAQVRIQARIQAVDSRAADWLDQLRMEDEEIMALLFG